MEGRRRKTPNGQMSAADKRDSLAGLTLDDVLTNQKRAVIPSNQLSDRRRTLLDIIREDESNKKDRKSWKAFKDKLRLKRAGSAWTSSILIPASDLAILDQNKNHRSLSQNQFPRRSSVRVLTFSNSDVTTQYMAPQPDENHVIGSDDPAPNAGPAFTRQSSTRLAGDSSENPPIIKPQISRHNSTRLASRADSIRRERVVTFRDTNDSDDDDDEGSDEEHPSRRHPMTMGEERQLSAREAVAAQEAAEAAAAAAAAAAAEEEEEGAAAEPVTMSLMDLLEETDRQMGLEGSRYRMADDDDEDEEEEDEDEGEEEHSCCVCMVMHKGSAFVPCGHAFCRLCSRELTASRGNCPLCNSFLLEILDVF